MKLDAKFNSEESSFNSYFEATTTTFNADFEGGGGSGISIHGELRGRELPDQHPIFSITGLEKALENAGTKFTTDETLTLNKNGVLSVNTAQEPEPDNTLPITAAAVASTVGNIEILLKTI